MIALVSYCAPIQRTIMSGDKETAICIMQMDEGLDTGDVILQRNFDIPAGMTAGMLHDKAAVMGAEMVLEALGIRELQGDFAPVKQASEGVTYAEKIVKEEAEIDWNKNYHEIDCHIRGLNPFPSAYFMMNFDEGDEAERVKLHEAEYELSAESDNEGNENGELGEIKIDLNSKTMKIACKDGYIIPKKLQRQGKKPMDVVSFLNGLR